MAHNLPEVRAPDMSASPFMVAGIQGTLGSSHGESGEKGPLTAPLEGFEMNEIDVALLDPTL